MSYCLIISNSQYIKEARGKPTLALLETIRRQVNWRFFMEKKEWIMKCKSKTCPRIVSKLDISKKKSLDMEALNASKDIMGGD